MRLKTLELEHFRNYHRLRWEFRDKPVTIVVGDNGKGKTNFLEAIVVMSLTKSFQGKRMEELTEWNEEWSRVSGLVETAVEEIDLEVFWGVGRQYPKTVKVKGVKSKATEYIGRLLTVLFSPQDLNMVHGSPQLRRRYVDVMLSQVDSDYLGALMEYRALLKQRNRLLGQILAGKSSEDELEFWDCRLADKGTVLLSKRRECFMTLNRHLSEDYSSIASSLTDVGGNAQKELAWNNAWGETDTRTELLAYLKSRRQRDIAAGATCGGPHREDFSVQMQGRDMKEFASRGECRTLVLALKLGEWRLMQERTGEVPVLLLDDVLSELDPGRQARVLTLFDHGQVVMTATHLEETIDTSAFDLVKVEQLF